MITYPTVLRFLRQHSIVAVVAALAMFVPSRANGQAVYGSVSGIVTDSTGAVVPGATVPITSAERKTSDTVVTNESGIYIKERLLPAKYEVKAELQGCNTSIFPDINVSVDPQ